MGALPVSAEKQPSLGDNFISQLTGGLHDNEAGRDWNIN